MKSPPYPRRLSFALSFAVAAVFAPIGAVAHDGHHPSRIVSDVAVVEAHGNILGLELVLTNNSQHAVTLQDVFAPAAQAAPMVPLRIAPGEAQAVDVTIFFDGSVPSIFTAILDFGEAGQGPVLVMK